MIVALTVVLAVSAVMDLALGVWASAFWESFRTTWFINPARAAGQEPQLLGLVTGLILIFFAALQADTIRGIRQEREGVYRFPIFFGGYLLVSSIVTYLVIQGWNPNFMTMDGLEFLLVDGIRGGCLVAFGILAMREPATVKELRLPKHVLAELERTGERSRDQSRRRRGRDGGRNRSDRSGSKRGGGRRAAAEASSPSQQRQGQSPRQQRQSGSAEPARSGSSEAAKDRSLSVVVKGEFRSGSDRSASSSDSGGNESSRDGRRRRRRRGGSASSRSERGADSNESTNGASNERATARAGMTRASFGAEPFLQSGNGTEGALLETRAGGVETASRFRRR